MKVKLLLLLLLPSLAQANIEKLIPKNSSEFIGNRNISITFQPWGGRGGRPGYKIIAFMDGSVIFDAVGYNQNPQSRIFKGVKFLQRKAENFVPVLQQIRDAKRLNPGERLQCEFFLADAGGYTLTVSDGTSSDVTYVNAGCGKDIGQAFDKVQKLFLDAVDLETEINNLREQIFYEQKKANK